jgi:hypothetical protein
LQKYKKNSIKYQAHEKNFFGVMAAMMVLTLSCKKDKEPEAVDPLIDLTLIC